MLPLPTPSPDTAPAFSALRSASAQSPAVLDSSESSELCRHCQSTPPLRQQFVLGWLRPRRHSKPPRALPRRILSTQRQLFPPLRSASSPPFGTRARVTHLPELSELSELDNPSPRRPWLPAAAPSSRALALFGGGAGLQLRPCRPPRAYRPRPCFVFEWLHSHRILPSTATALSIVVQCFTALAPSRSSALLLDTSDASDNSLHCLSTPPRQKRLSLGVSVSAAPAPCLPPSA